MEMILTMMSLTETGVTKVLFKDHEIKVIAYVFFVLHVES